MPAQTTKTGFSLDGALKAHAKDETQYRQDYTDLPGGIAGGEAELVAASLGEYKTGDNKGKKFVRLAATVISPVTAVKTVKRWVKDGTLKGKVETVSSSEMKVKGLQTSIMLPLCDTKNATAEENVATMLNELRTIGGEDFTSEIEDEDSLVSALQSLVDADPPVRIKFSTRDTEPSQQYPNSRAFTTWLGSVKADDTRAAAGSGVEIDGGGGAFNEFEGQDGSTGGDDATEAADETPDDWDALVARHDELDDGHEKDEIIDKLTKLATDAGVSAEAVGDAEDWAAVKELMDAEGDGGEGGDGAEETADEPADEPWAPTEGGSAFVKVQKDPKDKKKGFKKVAVVVAKIDAKKGTATVRDAATKKPILDGKNPRVFKLAELTEE